jgi:type I restriction-modification system DNA methylase subunit
VDGGEEDKYIESKSGMTITREKLKKFGFHKPESVPLTCFKFTYQIMTIPKEIADLVQAFEYHRPAYLRGQERYNEAQLRIQFVDPFFRALGWDIGNTQKSALKYLEVVVNDAINVHGKTLYLDYSFRYGENRKFIVETKKPSVRIKDDAAAALQLRRYAWNEKISLSILTNFDEFSVYDCTVKPLHGDSAAVARVAYFPYTEYPEKWDWIEKIFAKESIRKGSFDEFSKSTKGRRGTISVDEDLLSEIEKWRELLAKNIALRNKLSVNELNTVVQRTIDRILFLKICEDRNIEEFGTLLELTNNDQVYSHLCDQFRKADEKYNSGLFHFQKEPGWNELPDELSLIIKIDDKILKDIIKDLYPPHSLYLFNVIPPAILGQVYEQFLGKVIRLTEGGQAKIDFKPEVKKAGGVFYTPEFIVQYIVQQTVGELVKNKTPREVSKLKILDPACGSGSFLLGAYKYLLDWHIDWYVTNLVPTFKEKGSETDPAVKAMFPEPLPRKKGKGNFIEDSFPIYKSGEGDVKTQNYAGWKIKTSEKKRILLNNIFGVDVDPQAVEVTKLSLLLKVLADESRENISKQLKISDERALPSLDQNIKCGNSLIGTDIRIPDMPQEDVSRINPFDWEREFSEIMTAGGFDAVIGNPPYVRQEGLTEQKKYFETHYAVYQGTADLYTYFIEKGISLLCPKGQFSFIVANKWMRANYGKPLRKYLLTKQIEEIVDFGDLPVFKTATTYPCIIRVSNEKPVREFAALKVDSLDFPSLDEYVVANRHSVDPCTLTDEGWSLGDQQSTILLNKIKSSSVLLETYLDGKICSGIKTGFDEAYVIDNETRQKLIEEDPQSSEIIKPYLAGRDIQRYLPLKPGKFLIFVPWHFPIQNDATIIGASKKAENEFKKRYPAIYRHLSIYKERLSSRNPTETGVRYEWYALQRFGSNYYQEFEKPKIMYNKFQVKPTFSFDYGINYPNTAIFSIPVKDFYLLGVLNSKLGWFLISKYCTQIQNGYQLMFDYFGKIPIHPLNFLDPIDVARHDKMVSLVTQMLDLNKKLQAVRLDQEQKEFQRQIEATDAAIDKLVYELYGLTENEIKIVEGK